MIYKSDIFGVTGSVEHELLRADAGSNAVLRNSRWQLLEMCSEWHINAHCFCVPNFLRK
jgi:hypothetical protein